MHYTILFELALKHQLSKEMLQHPPILNMLINPQFGGKKMLNDEQSWNLVSHGRIILHRLVTKSLVEISKEDPKVQPRAMIQDIQNIIAQQIPEIVKDAKKEDLEDKIE